MPEPDYKVIFKCHRMIDFLNEWVNHNRQPDAYRQPADTLADRAKAFAADVKEIK